MGILLAIILSTTVPSEQTQAPASERDTQATRARFGTKVTTTAEGSSHADVPVAKGTSSRSAKRAKRSKATSTTRQGTTRQGTRRQGDPKKADRRKAAGKKKAAGRTTAGKKSASKGKRATGLPGARDIKSRDGKTWDGKQRRRWKRGALSPARASEIFAADPRRRTKASAAKSDRRSGKRGKQEDEGAPTATKGQAVVEQEQSGRKSESGYFITPLRAAPPRGYMESTHKP